MSIIQDTIPILVFFCLLRPRVTGNSVEEAGQKLCSAYGYTLVEAKFVNEQHWLCLKLIAIGTAPITSFRAALLLDPEAEETHNSIKAYPIDDVTMAYGYPVEDPSSGSAEGYIGDDNHFYGVLHLGNRTLHADPYGYDFPNESFGDFENDYVTVPARPRRDHSQMDTSEKYFPFRIEEDKYNQGIARARICDLLLLADKDFFEKDAKSSLNHAVRRMVHAVAQADIIFRNADFNEDGIPDNIGFAVKYILVLTSNETNVRVFGDLVSQPSPTVDGRQYLMRFARLRRLSEVCLGIAFSGLAFHNRTLGLSFTSIGGGIGGAAGGVCDRRVFGRSFNTLALAHGVKEKWGRKSNRIPERVAALTLSHELGHSFGAHHDEIFPNPECKGYLMGSQSPVNQNRRHYEFSICSKRHIAAKLHSMSYCLTVEDRPFCGNGIVEVGEACDCGLPAKCSQRDPCCTPRAGGALVYEEGTLHKEGCSVSPKIMCHPSQGLCCTQKCQYADLTKSSIDCTSLDRECTCANFTDCRCGLGGRCLEDGSCHAAECVSLGLSECACYKKGPGGVLGRMKMCGSCCLLNPSDGEREGRCVGVEFAAREVLSLSGRLPDHWPGENYTGSNVTLNICRNEKCYVSKVRAWREGEPCVSRNVVGLCSATGVCKTMSISPRSNVYPHIMHVQMASVRAFSVTVSDKRANTIFNLIVIILIKLLE